MRRWVLFVLIWVTVPLHARQSGDVVTLMKLTGAADSEDMDPQEVERLSGLLGHPLKINVASVSEIRSSGLFTPFQEASLEDYRRRHGDIVSMIELASVDGFSEEFLKVLAPFVSLEPREVNSGSGIYDEMVCRGAFRTDRSYSYGIKYRLTSRIADFSLSCSRSYGSDVGYPDAVSGSVVLKCGPARVLAGDINARFGQGLCLWSSSFMSSLTSPSAFMRKPSGLSPTFSFTGSSAFTGLAADMNTGRWRISLLAALPGLKELHDRPSGLEFMPALNVTRFGRHGHAGVTHYCTFSDFYGRGQRFRVPEMRTSADASLCVSGINMFAEVMLDWVNVGWACLLGADAAVCENLRMAAMARYIESQEVMVAVSGDVRAGRWGKGCFSLNSTYYPESSADAAGKKIQLKARADWNFRLAGRVDVNIRVSERFRTWDEQPRSEFRLDMSCMFGDFKISSRVNAADCVKTGFLSYIEGGYAGGCMSAYIRQGVFLVDDWQDRIYVYERDAPGSFNVPAMYGRGVWTSAYLTWKYSRWGKLCLRMSYTTYPLMAQEKRKPDRVELKLQMMFGF